jgi:hypothetical protein
MTKHITVRTKVFILPTSLFNPIATVVAPNKFLHLFILCEPAVLAYVMWHKVKIKNKFNVFKIAYCRELGAGGQRLEKEGRGKVASKNSLGCHYWQAATIPLPPLGTLA